MHCPIANPMHRQRVITYALEFSVHSNWSFECVKIGINYEKNIWTKTTFVQLNSTSHGEHEFFCSYRLAPVTHPLPPCHSLGFYSTNNSDVGFSESAYRNPLSSFWPLIDQLVLLTGQGASSIDSKRPASRL